MRCPAVHRRHAHCDPAERGAGRPRGSCRWALVLALLAALTAPPARSQEMVWELTPYRVRLIVAAAQAPGLAAGFQRQFARDVAERLSGLLGGYWDLATAEPTDALRYPMLEDLGSLTTQQLIDEDREALEYDKVMLVAVQPTVDGHQLTARELDIRTRLFSWPVRLAVRNEAKLCDAAVTAVWRAFAPLAEVLPMEEDGVVRLRLRAAGLAPHDPALAPLAEGDLFRPIVRRNDRDGRLRGVFIIPWTFLTVQQVSGPIAACELHTGLRSPLSGRRRGRTQNLALKVIPPDRGTLLVVRSRTAPYEPLAGYDVYAQSLDRQSSHWLGRTDSQGRVIIPPGPEPLRRVVIKHGGEILALLPLVPGLGWEPMLGTDTYRGQWPSEVPPSYLAGLLEPRDKLDESLRRAVQQYLAGSAGHSKATGPSQRGASRPAKQKEPTLPFGPYQGRPLSAVPRPYLKGLLDEQPRLDTQTRSALEYAMRRPPRRNPLSPPPPVVLEARVPDDDPRLKAEGFLNGLQAELIDLVVRREILLARAQARLAEKKYEEAEQLIQQIRTMKTREELRRRLLQEHKKIATNDPVLQQKIDRMFRQTEKVLLHYLDPKPVDALARQLVERQSGRSSGS